jgi:hypothetical protein
VLAAETVTGRLAVMVIVGMFIQAGLAGFTWGDWALRAATPLRAFQNVLAVRAPVQIWDPAGLTAGDNTENFARRHQADIKHSCIAMLAAMSCINRKSLASCRAAFLRLLAGSSRMCRAAWPPSPRCRLRAGVGSLSAWPSARPLRNRPRACGFHGRLRLQGADLLGPGCEDHEARRGDRERLPAHVVIIGMFIQAGLAGCAWDDRALHTASPLRAFENEICAQAPVGVWDRAGLAAGCNIENLARRRRTEIKRSRIAMPAAMSCITRRSLANCRATFLRPLA